MLSNIFKKLPLVIKKARQERIILREAIFRTWVCTDDNFLKYIFRNVAIFIRNMIGSFCTRDTRSSIAEFSGSKWATWSAVMFYS